MQTDRAADRSQLPESNIARTDTTKEHSSIAALMPTFDVATAQAPLVPPRSTEDTVETHPPARPVTMINADFVALSSGAATNTSFAPDLAAPASTAHTTIAGTSADKLQAGDFEATMTTNTLTAIAATQISPVNRTLAPPSPPAMPPHVQSTGSAVVPEAAAIQKPKISNDARQSLPRLQSSPDTTSESREGMLILDGAQLGRWIMNRLARQASRPTAGVTGIDPRISPIFPGAPVGV
jgi:hypothetical protein